MVQSVVNSDIERRQYFRKTTVSGWAYRWTLCDLYGHRVHAKRIRADALGHKPQFLLVFEALVQREQNCPLGAGGGPVIHF